MESTELKAIPASQIAVVGNNGRDKVLLRDLADMIESVKAVGVIQPVLVRPVEGEVPYELVAGERRYRSAVKAHGPDYEMPCVVREMTDDEAHELMLIENIQRRRLSPLAEARSFKKYIDRHGESGAEVLADKVKISVQRIQRRVAVLDLPPVVLAAWNDGVMPFGALELLLKVSPERAEELHDWWLDEISYGRKPHLGSLEGKINQGRLVLGKARFKVEEVCHLCPKNSQVQGQLFGMDAPEKVLCFDRVCFFGHQKAHYEKFWKQMALAREHGTTRPIFDWDVDHSRLKGISGDTAGACFGCEHYVSVLYADGSVYTARACVGPIACWTEKYGGKVSNDPEAVEEAKEEKAAQRKVQHGRDARELFYREKLSDAIDLFRDKDKDLGEADILRMGIFTLFQGYRADIAGFVAQNLGIDADADPLGKWYQLYDEALLTRLWDMPKIELMQALDLMSRFILVNESHTSVATRQYLGHQWYGLDIASQWELNEEFLKRKTKAELVELVGPDELNIAENPTFTSYLAKKYQTDHFASLKKKEMIDCITNCGMEMRGLCPQAVQHG